MGVGNVNNVSSNVYYGIKKTSGMYGLKNEGFTEKLHNAGEGSLSEAGSSTAGHVSAEDIYKMLKQGGRDKAAADKKEEESKETDPKGTETNIIVKPDGSRVLIMTISIGGAETTMSIEISKPTARQNDNREQKADNDSASSENNAASNNEALNDMAEASTI